MQKYVNIVDLVESFPILTNIYYLEIGVDTAENEPLKVQFGGQGKYKIGSQWTYKKADLEQDFCTALI